jgi:hypothetical protein
MGSERVAQRPLRHSDANLYALQGRGINGGPLSGNDLDVDLSRVRQALRPARHHEESLLRRGSGWRLSNIQCTGAVPAYLPAGTVGTTKEFTKIIPDGLLTPGAHVEYFFRDQKDVEDPGSL